MNIIIPNQTLWVVNCDWSWKKSLEHNDKFKNPKKIPNFLSSGFQANNEFSHVYIKSNKFKFK